MKLYPYQNTSLINLPKEKWKPIPGFEGYYELSNYGRIKAVEREAVSIWGTMFIRPERIVKGAVSKKYNKTLKEYTYNLKVILSRDGQEFPISLARYVYYLFKEKFDIDDRKIYIAVRDRDGRNIHVSNLYKTDMAELRSALYAEGRATSHLTKLSKPVTQFDQEGNPIQSFVSMYEAGKKLGINARNISEVVNGPGNMYKGYFWKTGVHSSKLNLRKLQYRGSNASEVNTSLQKRLRIKKVSHNEIPAFLNLSVKSMRGEKWKDIPGYEGLYQISNFGRVKGLQKITYGEKKMWMPEQIKKLSIDLRSKRKNPGSALSMVSKDGVKKTISVPRFVYYLFVKKFDLSDSTLRVYYKDGNPLNLHYRNLTLQPASMSFAVSKKKSRSSWVYN